MRLPTSSLKHLRPSPYNFMFPANPCCISAGDLRFSMNNQNDTPVRRSRAAQREWLLHQQ
jgi:hypothetical protein